MESRRRKGRADYRSTQVAWKKPKRSPAKILLPGAVILLVLIVGGGFWGWRKLQDSKAAKEALAIQSSFHDIMAELENEEANNMEAIIQQINPPAIPVPEETDDGIILIVIDPGHGGYDAGSNVGDAYEKDINLSISLKVLEKLLDMELGYEYLMTREDDSHLFLEERAEIANKANADICVSIHQNIYDTSEAYGAETYYMNPEEEVLAQYIQTSLIAKTQARDRGVREENLFMIRETAMPAVLVETGYISNPAELRNLLDEEYQEKIAEGIAEGIVKFARDLEAAAEGN